MKVGAAIAALLLLTAPAWAQPAAALYVITYTAGPAWQAGKPMAKQALGPHAAYMKKLLAEGRTVAAGPTFNLDGGVVILKAESLEAAQAIMAADPAVTSGLFTGELRSWTPMFSSGEPLAPAKP